jgi:phosphohistidine phosphatase
MKRLTILRHAKSSWDDSSLGDFDRPLNPRGWNDARRIGREFNRRGLRFNFGLASPAARVRETLDGLAESYGQFTFEIRFEPRVYEASLATLLDLVRTFPESANAALLVGHNPGVERLIIELTSGSELRDQVTQKFPTAAAALIDLRADRWADVRSGSGTLAELILPKGLD